VREIGVLAWTALGVRVASLGFKLDILDITCKGLDDIRHLFKLAVTYIRHAECLALTRIVLALIRRYRSAW